MMAGSTPVVANDSTRAIGLGRAMTIATTYPIGAALLEREHLAEALQYRRF